MRVAGERAEDVPRGSETGHEDAQARSGDVAAGYEEGGAATTQGGEGDRTRREGRSRSYEAKLCRKIRYA